ncbi:MAG TPA: hypothetical protein VK939_00725 [Longimicrobiales bacterium]|nr:hypothetical protein [Longimicrobiales bacterium]
MSHLNLETLARLVDEAPTALEAAHLAGCAECRDELQALHEQGAQLGALPALQPPPEDWDRLERRLQEEGLIRAGLTGIRLPRRQTPWLAHAGRAAAAVALFAIGTLAGRTLQPVPRQAAAPPIATPVVNASSPSTVSDSPPAAIPATDSAPVADPIPQLRLTGNAPPPAARAPRTAEEAFDLLQNAETSYLEALARFAELSGSTRTDDPTARLAALEGIVLTTRAALARAPTDPVINGYHLTALAQRDATLRQVSASGTDSW